MKSLHDARLYGILDLGYVDVASVRRVAAAMIDGGVDIIQLRAKRQSLDAIVDLAQDVHELTAPASVPLVINDYPEVAMRVGVEGVHLGQDDEQIAAARQKAGRPIIVGKSTHSLEQARAGHAEGADYIGFGPIFATPTKPDYTAIGLTQIKQAHVNVTLPIFCIGGIKIDNLPQVIAAGARRVAIVSGILKAQDVAKYTRTCKELLSAPSTF